MYKKILSTFLALLLIGQGSVLFAKNGDDSEEKAAEIKKQVTELLRETQALTGMLNSPSNRINFTVSTADVLWDLDKDEARAMFTSAVEDVRKMISQIDSEMNFASSTNSTGNGFSNRRGNSRNNRNSKVNQVLSWRSSVVNSLSNRDAEWAMQFVEETALLATNPNLKRRIDQSNRALKSRLVRKIAEQDVTKALVYGREKLSKGVSSDVINILQKVYAKDKQKGVEFGEEVVSKLDSIKLNRSSTWMVVRLFQAGLNVEVNSGNSQNETLFSDSSMRALAGKLTEQVLQPTSRYRSFSPKVISGLEKYAPQKINQVKTVFEQRTTARTNQNNSRGRPNLPPNGVRTNGQNNRNTISEISKLIASLNKKDIPPDEKSKIIDDTRNLILSLEDERLSLRNLIWLATTASKNKLEDKASEVLNDAERFVNPEPKMKNDFSDSRMLANAYAPIDSDKTFQILENMAYRLNGVINGYIKFMEYSDNKRVVENGELVMNNYSRQFTSYFNLSPTSLKSLVNQDFNRVKDLSDKFERQEVRVATRIIIAKSLLRANGGNSVNIPVVASGTEGGF
jgi:hypothetical protein